MRFVMAAELTRLTRKIATLRRLVAESRITCRSRSNWRQFGNFLTDLYTLRDAVRTFIHALRTFPLRFGKYLSKRKVGLGKSCTAQ